MVSPTFVIEVEYLLKPSWNGFYLTFRFSVPSGDPGEVIQLLKLFYSMTTKLEQNIYELRKSKAKIKQTWIYHDRRLLSIYPYVHILSVTGGSPFMWCYHPSKNYSELNSWPPIFINNLCNVVWGEGVRLQWHPGMFGGHEGGEGQNFDLISGEQ